MLTYPIGTPDLINPDHGYDGCMRCRMDLIRFKKETKLPRFTMHEGETWNLPQTSYLENGVIELGHGVALPDSYEIVTRDVTRANHNDRRHPCMVAAKAARHADEHEMDADDPDDAVMLAMPGVIGADEVPS